MKKLTNILFSTLALFICSISVAQQPAEEAPQATEENNIEYILLLNTDSEFLDIVNLSEQYFQWKNSARATISQAKGFTIRARTTWIQDDRTNFYSQASNAYLTALTNYLAATKDAIESRAPYEYSIDEAQQTTESLSETLPYSDLQYNSICSNLGNIWDLLEQTLSTEEGSEQITLINDAIGIAESLQNALADAMQ